MAKTNLSTTTFCQLIAEQCWRKYFNVNHAEMESCYLDSSCFEPRSIKSSLLYPLVVVYSLILVSGVIGNLATCLVITTSNYCLLQTTTNRYLLNLALADLVGLISGIPFEIYLMWNQYPWHPPDFVCHLKAWVSETTSYVSVLTIVTFSIERYVAICHSFVMTKLSASINRHLAPVLLLSWFVAGLCAAPYGVYHKTGYVLRQWPGDTGGIAYGPVKKTKMCMLAIAFDPGLRPVFQILFHASAVFFFFLPLTVLVGLYGKVGWVVKRSRRALNGYCKGRQQSTLTAEGDRKDRKWSTNTNVSVPSNNSPAATSTAGRPSNNSPTAAATAGRQDYNSKKVLSILVAVVVTFFVCYAPYQAQRLLFFYIEDAYTHQLINTYLFTISGILFYLSSILNPILYNVISARYRRAFREVLCRGLLGTRVYEERYYKKWHFRFHKQASGIRRRSSWSSAQLNVVKAMMSANARRAVSVLEDRQERVSYHERDLLSLKRKMPVSDQYTATVSALPPPKVLKKHQIQQGHEKSHSRCAVVSAVVPDKQLGIKEPFSHIPRKVTVVADEVLLDRKKSVDVSSHKESDV